MYPSERLVCVAVLLCCCLWAVAQAGEGSPLVSLGTGDFEARVSSGGDWLVEFYAPWCGWCKKLQPVLEELATELEGSDTHIAQVDATVHKELANAFKVFGFPKMFYRTADGTWYQYSSRRDIQSFRDFFASGYKNAEKVVPDKIEASANTADNPASEIPPMKDDGVLYGSGKVEVLTDDNMDAKIKEGVWFIEFYAPWCGWCKKLAPTWDQLAAATGLKTNIAKVDATVEKVSAERFKVKSFPTLKLVDNGNVYAFEGERTLDALKNWAAGGYKSATASPLTAAPPKLEGPTQVISLTDEDGYEKLKTGVWFVEFYAPWCGWCKKLAPTWEQLARDPEVTKAVNVANVDATEAKKLAALFDVGSFPTLKLMRDGLVYAFPQSPDRSFEALKKFALEDYKYAESSTLPKPAQAPVILGKGDLVDSGDSDSSSVAIELTDDNFDTMVSSGRWLINFCSAWTGWCRQLSPEWEKLAQQAKANGGVLDNDVKVASVYVERSGRNIASRLGITTYPTIWLVSGGQRWNYDGDRTQRKVDHFKAFVAGGYKSATPQPLPDSPKEAAAIAETEGVVVLDDMNFDQRVPTSGKAWLIEFYAPWCGWCKKLEPVWTQLGNTADVGAVVAKVDATEAKALATRFNVKSFPTIKLWADNKVYTFKGERNVANFIAFAKGGYKDAEEVVDDTPPVVENALIYEGGGDGEVVALTADDFDKRIGNGNGWFLEFYAPWCGWCKKLEPIWKEAAAASKGAAFHWAKIDATVHSDLAARVGVKGYPTLRFYKGGKMYSFSGSRDVPALIAFAKGGYLAAESTPFELMKPPPPLKINLPAEGKEEDVVVLTDDNMGSLIRKGRWMVEFYAPWCGHCKNLMPTWNRLGTAFKGEVGIGKVDCTTQPKLKEHFNIKSFPTLLYFQHNQTYTYSGSRDADALSRFLQQGFIHAKATGPLRLPRDFNPPADDSEHMVVLNDENFLDQLSSGTWLVEFYAPWCGHCKKLAPTWSKLADRAHEDKLGFKVAKVDATAQKRAASTFSVSSYPAIFLFKDGEFYAYNSPRKIPTFIEFVKTRPEKGGGVAIADTGTFGVPVPLNDESMEYATQDGRVWFIGFLSEKDGKDSDVMQALNKLAEQGAGLFSVGVVRKDTGGTLFSRYAIGDDTDLIMFHGNYYYRFPADKEHTAEEFQEFVGHGGYTVVPTSKRLNYRTIGPQHPLSLINYGAEVWLAVLTAHPYSSLLGCGLAFMFYGVFLATNLMALAGN